MLQKVGILGVMLLFCVGLSLDALAQQQPPPRGQRGGQQAPPQQTQQQPRPQQDQDRPFITGYMFGIGLNAFQGDLSNNGNNNMLKYVTNADINLMVGMDHRMGEFEQYGVQARLSYDHIHGKATGPRGQLLEFGNSLINLDILGAYELPYIRQGLLRVFAGGGPTFVIAPFYGRYPPNDDRFDTSLKTRVIASGVVGVTIFDTVHLGTRITSTDFLDGYEGFSDKDRGFPDLVTFINVGFRLDRVR